MSMTRKDYGSGAIVPIKNAVMRRLTLLNSPYSYEATGVDLWPHDGNAPQSTRVPLTQSALDDATEAGTLANSRVQWGNKTGYVKSVTDDGGDPKAFVSGVFTFLDKEKNEVDETLTAAEVIASGDFFIMRP